MRRGRGARDERRERADALKVEREKRSPEQQIAELDSRLGIEAGATKEREQLRGEIEARLPKRESKRKPKVEGDKRKRKRVKAKERRRQEVSGE